MKQGTTLTSWHGEEAGRSAFRNFRLRSWSSFRFVMITLPRIGLGYIVQIASDELAEAITSLPAEKRNIILLSYFLEMTDMEIAELLNMVRSSVAYRRTATLKLLKELMGGKTDDS